MPHLYAATVAVMGNDADIWGCDAHSDIRIEICVDNISYLTIRKHHGTDNFTLFFCTDDILTHLKMCLNDIYDSFH